MFFNIPKAKIIKKHQKVLKEPQYYLGELAKSTIDPALLQKIAEWTDDEKKRQPSTILEHIETGIPGLREDVPTKNSEKGNKNTPTDHRRRT